MKKYIGIIASLFALSFVLIACSSDNNNEQANNESENQKTNNEDISGEENEEGNLDESEDINEENDGDEINSKDNEETNEEGMAEVDKEALLDRYEDDLGLGDTTEWERSDGLSTDHIKFTVNSFKIKDELNGMDPKNDLFLLVNVTIENLLGDESYSSNLIRSSLEGSGRGSFQNEKDELALDFDEEENGISTGDVVYDVSESDYYRIHFFDDYYLIFMDDQTE